MHRIGLITSDSTLASIFDPVLGLLNLELVIAPPDADHDIANVDLILWHDSEAAGCVPSHFAALGVPMVHLAPLGQAQSLRLGGRCPPGYQVADYYLVYPFDSTDAVAIFGYWLERNRKQ